MEGIPAEGVTAKHIIVMKFSTEAVVALVVAIVFALLSVGAIAREQGQRSGQNQHNTYVAANNINLSQVAANDADVLGLY